MAWFSLLVQQVISKLIVPKSGGIRPLYLPVNGTAVTSKGKSLDTRVPLHLSQIYLYSITRVLGAGRGSLNSIFSFLIS